MSRLLINEAPLQVLPTLAVKVGLNEAIFLQQLHYRLRESRMIEGRRWYSRSMDEWCATFPFWSKRTVERIVTSLRNRDLIETTADYNREPDDRTLWYTLSYAALDDLEFAPTPEAVLTEKRDEQPIRQNGGRLPENTDEQPIRQNGGAVSAPEVLRADPTANMAGCSSIREVKTPTTPEAENPHLSVVLGGGVGGEFQNWTEHLNLQKGPALNLTLALWAGWVEGGLIPELKEASTAVILMGGKATDPSALLKARMERKRELQAVQVARAAAGAATFGAASCQPGERRAGPDGRVWTVEEVAYGAVIFEEVGAPQDQPDRVVATWAVQA
ncbi:hypothetical protein [Deinococcus petrolearius]|uniref:Bacteriophage lambda Replication protein O N-terminal domain-containing protein n=1 Tax=Deinococcus petrolearius TaxID=1751295 RepID=A0ABW1DH71_9DEIO